ncbi:hypothetical protein F5Y00DRAFT_232611 [Daldinia vernicosa]|uniref:uncharacterized protein n=1 Tax=Daldinia vernicosa TaxID=114800 RepID=UPI00200788A4|nr:uncharacterized protein F5Y00DRAFT_232611 [Daldinia vernicosa]KAI0850534.1 hypothetical protein F5Y00DRAFT_232611 [Daldinia vernicosa]
MALLSPNRPQLGPITSHDLRFGDYGLLTYTTYIHGTHCSKVWLSSAGPVDVEIMRNTAHEAPGVRGPSFRVLRQGLGLQPFFTYLPTYLLWGCVSTYCFLVHRVSPKIQVREA